MASTYKVLGGDRKEYGPVSAEEVCRWLAEGRLNGQSLIQAEGTADWQPLASFPELTNTPGRAVGTPPVMSAGGRSGTPGPDILTREPRLDIGRCLARAGALLRDNFGLLAGSTALVWFISMSEFIPLIGLVYHVFAGVFYGGLYCVFLKRIRGEAVSMGDTFFGFGSNFGQLALVGFISWLLMELGFVLCVVPGIYLMVAWIFSVPLVVDRQLEFWSAMELSRKVVTRMWFPMLGLLLAAFAPVIIAGVVVSVKSLILGLELTHTFLASGIPTITRIMELGRHAQAAIFPFVVASKLVLLLNLPFAVGAIMYAYEDLFGARTARTP